MSTRSHIAILNPDNTVEFVYCHHDGYLDHVGDLLKSHYNTEEKIRELLKGGDMSSLGQFCTRPAGHSYNTPVDGYTVYYGRDRGETGTDCRKKPIEVALEQMDEDYSYLFQNGEWTYRQWGKGEFQRF